MTNFIVTCLNIPCFLFSNHLTGSITVLRRLLLRLMRMNSQHVILLVLLDPSVVFDTVDHETLLKRLQSKRGVTGKALDWFSSYLSDRSQCV